MAEPQTTAKRGPDRVRTAGEGTPGGPPARPRPGGARKPAPRRGNAAPTGGGARLLAPLALIVCVFAVIGVLSAGGSDAPTRDSGAEQTSASEGSGDEKSSDAGEGATQPVRSTYRVKPGDSFAAIAEKTGVDVDTLAELNPDVDPRALQPGQKLKLK